MKHAALALALLISFPALAEPQPEVVREAKRRFQRANQLYQDGRYTDALHLYQAAYDLVPSPDILFNLGLTKEKVFDYEGCSIAFRDYLKDGGDKPQARARLDQCRARTLIPVKVSSLPSSASVSLGEADGRSSRGRTPTRLDLKPGTYTITVDSPGYLPQSQTLTLEEGVHPEIDFTLEKLSTLRIEADISGAEVLVDDHLEGTSPVQREIKAGLHHVQVQRSGYRTVTRDVRVNAGDQMSLVMSLPPLPRERSVALEVAHAKGASVRFDGTELGLAPLQRQLPAGEHRLQVARAGYLTFDGDLQIPDDRDLKLRVHLTPRRTRSQRAAFWTLESVASAAALGGLVFGALALTDQRNFDDVPTLALGDSGRNNAIASDALFGVSAAVGIAGAIYYLATWPRGARVQTLR